MMDLVDTHCHIQSIGLNTGEKSTRELWAKTNLTADQVVANALEAGISRMICVGCDLEDSRLAVDFAQSRQHCWASVGIHPHEAQHYVKHNRLEAFAALATQPKVVAIGECGLDYYYSHSPKSAQLEVLRFQIELALKHDLPLIFHVREAFDDFWPVFDQYEDIRGVLHSYTDNAANLAKALGKGLYIGVNGIATFHKDGELSKVHKTIPTERLLLETDAPFLTPKPFRGNINEPKQIGTIVGFVAQLREQEVLELAAATTTNARQLFGV